ncbi:ABC transporter permease, partial [Rubrivirga sp.]|uniref:ABC transporter permease n=1 Tax=Rubrivirga sp. TaxID=1885344 RepID=UPI003C791099
MPRHYLTVAFRALRRHPGYASLNVVGLAVGIACCLFLLLFVQDELSYDRHHHDAESVFRVTSVPGFDESDRDREIISTPAHVAQLLEDELPTVQASARLYTYWRNALVTVGDDAFEETGFYSADPNVFDVLTHRFIQGDPGTALLQPDAVVLTESTAQRYFGDVNPIGQTIIRDGSRNYQVTGVIEDVPEAAHYDFDLIDAMDPPDGPVEWGTANYFTYVRANNAGALPGQLDALIDRLEAEGQDPWTLRATPVTDIRLYSELEGELKPTGTIRTVVGFATVALLILLIACINYMNLATARSAKRAEEVGLRKSLGAHRSQLVTQFYSESALMTVFGVLLALLVVAIGLPWFNALSGKALMFGALTSPGILAIIGVTLVVVTFVAGSYPALHLSSAEPVRALRGGSASGGTSWVRQGLVVFQFGISAVLVVGTLVVLSQVRFLGDQDLGFDKEQVVALPLSDSILQTAAPAIKQELLQSPRIEAVGAVNAVPGEVGWTSSVWGEGMPTEQTITSNGLPAGADVADGLGLRVVAGAAFENPPTPDSTNFQFLVNESAARQLGWTPIEAVGRALSVDGRRGRVRGVVQDFHFQSLHASIAPLAIWYQPDAVHHLAVRLAPGDTRAAMADLEAAWGQFASHRPFAYRFLDDVYDGLYRSEQRLGDIVSLFAGLAILVACLGLFGLAAFTAQQRTKEIGVRKVLGATVPNLVALLTKDFVALVGVAFAISVPLAWVGMSRWLDGFAYHVTLGPAPFLAAGALLVVVALATVSAQALR